MEVHAVSGGWVLEWSGCTGSSIVKATVGVAGFLVVASGVVQGVRHRSVRWYSHKGRLARDNTKEPDAAVSNQTTKELEGEIGSADNQRVVMATARASDLPVIIVSGADSPRSRIGRGLESIGGMTAETLQRISTAVGGVMKSPVVLMSKVGGLASPRAAALTAPPGSSLEERVYYLEIQMKSLEERFNSMTVVTELTPSPHSHKEKPRIAKSLLQELETDRTLVNRVQILEDDLNKRMKGFEKALSSIQTRLDHIESSRRESVAGFERQESLSYEPQFYDAEQVSDNFGEADDLPGEATGGSPALEKSRAKETSSAAPTTAKHVEPLQEPDAGENDDFLEPPVVSTPVYSKEAFLTQPMKSAAPNSEPAESVHRDDASSLPASSEQQLASTLEELHGSFVTESSAAAASAKFLEIARAITAEKSTLAHASSEPQSTSALEEPREALPEEPSAAVPVAKSEEHAQEDADDKSGTPTFEATQKEPLAAALDAEIAQELATQGLVIIALPSFEPPVTSKSVEAPSVAVPSANSEESTQEETGDKSVTMTAARESPKEDFVEESLTSAPGAGPAHEPSSQEDSSTTSDTALASSESPVASKSMEEPLTTDPGANSEEPAQEDIGDKSVTMTAARESPKEDFVEESLTSAPGAGPAHEPSSQADSSETSDTALASSESPVEPKSVEEPPTADPGANFEEPAHEDTGDKSDGTVAVAELPSAPSLEGPQEESVKELAPSAESPQVLATQEDDDMQVAAPESRVASQFVEEPSAAAPSAHSEEPTQEDVADKIGTTMAATEPSLASSYEEPEKDSEKEAMASVPSGERTQEHSDMAIASFETEGASKSVEEASATTPSANLGEREHKADADENGTFIASAESPLASFDDPQEDSEKESSATAPSAELARELATQEDSSKAFSPPETTVKSKFAEEPSTGVESVGSEEPAHEDVDKAVTTTTAADSPLPIPHQGPQEDFEKESLADTQSTAPIHEPSSPEDSGTTSDKALASSEPQVASKFEEDPSSNTSNVNSEEPAHEDVDKGVTTTTATDSPLPIPHQDPQEDFEEESSATAPSTEPIHEPSSPEDSGTTSDKALASSEPQVASKFAEDPSTGVESVGSEEPAHEDVDKAVTTTTATDSPLPIPHQDPQEDFEEESSATAPSTEPIHEPSSPEDSGTTSDKALASSEPQVASKFAEDPLTGVESVGEEPADEDVDKAVTTATATDSPLPIPRQDPQEDFEKESLAAAPSTEPIHEPSSREDSGTTSDKALASSEPQVASKFAEDPSSNISNVGSEEPAHEDGAVKSDTVIADAKSPSVEPHEEKESMAAVPGTEPAQELATKEDSDMAPFEPQVASKFVEEPSAIDAPSAKFEERAHEDIVDKSGSETTGTESPSTSPLEAHKEDDTEESLEAGASAKVVEPAKEDESEESPIAFAPLETPSPSFFGISQEASSKEPSEASVQPKENVQEESGIVLPSADSTLTSTMEEDNRATKESEYKLAEDFKVHPQHTESIEKEFPRNQSNLAHVSSEESFATEDGDDRLESDQSDENFFDVDNDSGNFDSLEFDEPGEATGINAVAQKETRVPPSSVEPAQALEQAPARELEQEADQVPAREPEQEHDHAPARESKQEPDQAPARELEEEPDQAPAQEREQDHESVDAQDHGQQPAQEPEQEDLTRNSALALPPSESQVTSEPGESQELPAEEPMAAVPNTNEESREVNAADDSGTLDLPSATEEPKIDSAVSLEKSLSSASFQQSGNAELPENPEHESSDTPGTSSTPQETLEREPSTAAPTTEIAQGHDTGKSDNVHKLLGPQSEESKEALANEPVKAVPSSDDGQNGARPEASSEPQSIPTLEEPQEGYVKEASADAESTSKSVDLEDSLADEPSTVTSSAKLAQESDADKISAGLVEESALTSIAEEPQNGSVSSPAKGKHVKIIAEPTEAIPRAQSDLTHVESNPKATEDATKLQSQGSFLAFGADSKEGALAKESLPSAKLLELFEEENNSGERGPVLADSPMTSTVEEPQKPLRAEEPLASAKSVPKGHMRRRGFARSSSEPQFAYKLEEHRKALAKESSVAAIPSASKLGEEHAQEDFGDTQCLPFRILGEGKHPRKESELKLVEDAKSPATKSETAASPYVLESRPSRIKLKKKKEKEKKEKKEKKPDAAAAEEKERRLSLGSGEMERKSSLRAEEKGSKYSPRAEEKHKQPFRHLRDRLRHAFSVNKEP